MDADDTIGGAAQLRGGKLSGAREGFPFAAAAAGPGHRHTGDSPPGTGNSPAEEPGKVSDWPSFGGALLGGSGGRALTVTIDRRKRQKQLTLTMTTRS